MLPVLTRKQIKKIDSFTIINEPIESTQLMERAATACYNSIKKEIIKNNSTKTIHIFCGLGNNGGDGLVIARKFKEDNYNIRVYKLFWGQKASDDFLINEQILNNLDIDVTSIKSPSDFPEIIKEDFIIDAIFGIGLSRPIDNFAIDIIKKINLSQALIISIDTPSGLPSEPIFKLDSNKIIKADFTLTFQLPKLSFLLPNSGNFTGDFTIIPIGLNEEYIREQRTNNYYIDSNYIKQILKKREKFSHKGDYGHALLICGSLGKIGAAILSAQACLKSGVGLLSIQVPHCGYDIIHKTVPEAMIIDDQGMNNLESIVKIDKYSSIGIGPGIDKHIKTCNLVENLLDNYSRPIVIDADAINIIAENPDYIQKIPKNSILTPHPGEFRRLVGDWDTDQEKHRKLLKFCIQNNVYITLKGAHSALGCPDGKILFNSTGNPGMATAGSGDVLTGIITSFLSQGYSSLEASIIGIYFHGLSGDLSKNKIGEISLNASDIVKNLSNAFNKI